MRNILSLKHDNQILYFFIGVYVFIVMLVCAGSSPIIGRMGTDSSVFFMVGRGMASGKVPYLDMFDHKGWYIYFINYLGALINPSGSFGIFLVEFLFMYLSAILVYKIFSQVYSQEEKRVSVGGIAAAMIGVALFLNNSTFEGGNFVEDYCILLQLISTFLLVLFYQKTSNEHPPRYMLIHGICAGIAFWLRANLVFMWGAVAVVILVELMIKKQYRCFIFNIAAGLLGVVISSLPPILYAVATNSFHEMIEQTFLFNMYYSGKSGGVFSNIVGLFRFHVFLALLVISLPSCIIIIRTSRVHKYFKWIFCMGFFFSVLSVALSGRYYGHYFVYLLVFAFPLIFLLIRKVASLSENRMLVIIRAATICCIFGITICANLCLPIKVFGAKFSGYYRYMQVVNTISDIYKERSEKDSVVLVTNNNCIFYNRMHAFPNTKFFYLPSISYELFPDAIDGQTQSILSGENDVVIIDYRNKQVFGQGEDDRILSYLSETYQLRYESDGFQMWTKKQEGS